MEQDWKGLAKKVHARRVALGLTKREAIARAKVSPTTWLKVENDAQPIGDKSWSGIDRALNWEPGSVMAILSGGEPTEAPEPPTMQEQLDALRRRIEALEAKQHN